MTIHYFPPGVSELGNTRAQEATLEYRMEVGEGTGQKSQAHPPGAVLVRVT